MVQFRLTQKYAKDCRVSVLSEPKAVTHPLDDWFIDVIRVHRKKIAMVTHAQSAFTCFIPYAEAGGAVAIPEGIGMLLKKFLSDYNLSKWEEQVDELFSKTATFCKTMDRKILGYMNNFKQCVEGFIDYSPECMNPICWNSISDMINNMSVNFGAVNKYSYPTEMSKKLLDNSSGHKSLIVH